MMAMNCISSISSSKWQPRFCSHPIFSRRNNVPASMPRSIRKRTILRTHRFSHQSLSPSSGQEHVPKYDIVPASSLTPTPALAFKTFPSPFSPLRRTPGRRSGTRCSAHLLRSARRQRSANLTRIRPSSAAATRMLTGAARRRRRPGSRTGRRTTTGTCSWTRSLGLMQ
ncbi:hypothetical protein EDB86DRAFT_583579 [Lactarius hatsudake]|nr:hypothetical protein EDB86DRAFT_583579 [Lactarius hatsudake]